MWKNLPDNFGAFVISAIVVVGFIAVALYVLLHGVQDNPTLQTLVGALTAQFIAVVQYWIGSSSGSKNKDAVIAAQANANLPSPATVTTTTTPPTTVITTEPATPTPTPTPSAAHAEM